MQRIASPLCLGTDTSVLFEEYAVARPLLSHIDLRVRDRARSIAFYDALFETLGFGRRESEDWTSYYDLSITAAGPADFEWFGFVEDPAVTPNQNRMAFIALSNDEVDRVGSLLHRISAQAVEGPNYDEGPGYYAVFFDDPDGHKLEVCCRVD